MTWRGERRKQLPPGWAALRKRRLELDGYQCTHLEATQVRPMYARTTRCTAPATEVHHALAPNDHRIESLRSLCHYHHQQHTQEEAQAARGAGAKRARFRQPHPGLRQ